MKQYDELIVAGSTLRIMQTNVVDVRKAVTNRHLALWLHDLWSTQQTPDPRSRTKQHEQGVLVLVIRIISWIALALPARSSPC